MLIKPIYSLQLRTPHYKIVSSVLLAHFFIPPSFNIIELEHFSHPEKGKIHLCFLRRKQGSLSPMKTESSGSHNLTCAHGTGETSLIMSFDPCDPTLFLSLSFENSYIQRSFSPLWLVMFPLHFQHPSYLHSCSLVTVTPKNPSLQCPSCFLLSLKGLISLLLV